VDCEFELNILRPADTECHINDYVKVSVTKDFIYEGNETTDGGVVFTEGVLTINDGNSGLNLLTFNAGEHGIA